MDSSQSTSNSIQEQLLYLRKLTEITGILHEAQIMHLKLYWGLVTGEAGKQFAVDFDNKLIEFRAPAKTKIQKDMIKPFLEGIRFILGDKWIFRFIKGTKEISL